MPSFFEKYNRMLSQPQLSLRGTKAPIYRPPDLKRKEALPIRAKDIALISTNSHFVRDYLKVHSLEHYKRELISTALTQPITADIECLLFDVEDLGQTLA